MSNHYRVYEVVVVEKDTPPDEIVLEWTRGCNGENHVDHLIEISPDGEGDPYAVELLSIEQGDCDGTCGPAIQRGFFYPEPD